MYVYLSLFINSALKFNCHKCAVSHSLSVETIVKLKGRSNMSVWCALCYHRDIIVITD